MSKNIVMQELTANRYEELYPKTNSSEIKIDNSNINDFLGGGNSAEDAFMYLANLNCHWWLKKSEENVYGLKRTQLSKKYIYVSSRNSDFTISGKKGTNVSVNQKTGALSLVNGENFSVTVQYGYPDEGQYWPRSVFGAANSNYVYWKGDYYQAYLGEATDYDMNLYFSYRSSDTYAVTISDYASSTTKTYQLSSEVVGTQPTYSYVSSPNPSAYPDNGATQDNAQYWYIGQPFTYLPRLGKVEVGSYVGTGLGSVTLTFENAPKILQVTKPNTNSPRIQQLIWIEGQSNAIYINRDSSLYTLMTNSNKNYSFTQLNTSNETYYYFAITQ